MAGKHRKQSRRARKFAMVGAATATATAMTVGVAPAPEAQAAVTIDIPPDDPLISVDLPLGVYTTGVPFRLVDGLANILLPDLPIDAVQFLSALDPQAFYNSVNATPNEITVTIDNPLGGSLPPLEIPLRLRVIAIASFGFASYTTMDTYRKLAESTRTGEAPGAGYTPVEQAPPGETIEFENPLYNPNFPILGPELLGSIAIPSLPSTTLLALVLIRDPGRPNGGIGARMAPLFALFGVDTVTPDVEPVFPDGFDITKPIEIVGGNTTQCPAALGCVLTTWEGGAALIPIHVNLAWQYDPVSDFPATANPISIANSLMAGAFPTYILRGLDLDALGGLVTETVITDALEAVLSGGEEEEIKDALNIYLTIGSDSLPLLEPQRLLVDAINLVTGLGLGTPISDSIEPALKILVNIGYTDVVTPADLAAPGADYPDYIQPYDRYMTDDSMATPTPFFSQTIDLQEALAVPGDVVEALVDGFTETFGNGYQISDPTRRNALVQLLSALGLGAPTLAAEESNPVSTMMFDAGSDEDLVAEVDEEVDDVLKVDDGSEDEAPPTDDEDEDEEKPRFTLKPRDPLLSGLKDAADRLLGVDEDEDEIGDDEAPSDEQALEDEDEDAGPQDEDEDDDHDQGDDGAEVA